MLAATAALASTPAVPAAPALRATRTFHIAAGPLEQALHQFSAQSGLQILYDPAVVHGGSAARFDGAAPVGAVLDALLRHLDLTYELTDPTTLIIKRAPPGRQEASARVAASPRTRTRSLQPTLSAITVTGSLIPHSEIETAAPVTSISTRQMERFGFGGISQFLRANPLATGAVENNQFAGGFTEGAQTLSLLGLDPGFTLYLIDGHPVADYPLPYDGVSSFVDLSSVPTGMVEHADIVPGDLSSIYGSSAIAGVVNFVLKPPMEGYELNVRSGGFSNGGGDNQRIEFLGGSNNGRWKSVYGVQLQNQRPIWNYQQKLSAASADNPDPSARYPTPTYIDKYFGPSAAQFAYRDPGAAACAGVSGLVRGTTGYDSQPDSGPPFSATTGQPVGPGYYCGSPDQQTYITSLDQDKAGTGYVNVHYRLDDSTELYATVLSGVSSLRFAAGPYFWTSNLSGGGIFINPDTGNLETMTHLFAPEEIGDWKFNSTHDLVRSYDAWLGLRGRMESWRYDVYFARSQQNLIQKQWWPLTDAVNAFFQNRVLGPQLGAVDGLPVYSPNYANFYTAITPAQYATFDGLINTHSQTWNQNFNIQLTNNDLFQLPGGPAAFAGVFQYGEQVWSNPTDPAVIEGKFYGLTGASGAGARNNWAFAGEFRVPLAKALTADLSARQDFYSNHDGGADDDVTYKLGLEFRPTDRLLLRGNYGTGFRAPDMSYVFGGQSAAYVNGLTDYYRCALVGGPLDECPYFANQQVFALHRGNRNLESVTAKSYGAGIVWSPTPALDFKADYYNIKIADEVQLQDIDELLKSEAACRLAPIDPDSSACAAALSQVNRAPADSLIPDDLLNVQIYPINIAKERVSGIIASAGYQVGLGRLGKLALHAQYNVTLKHTRQQYPFDSAHDLLRNPFYSSEFKSIASASITWDIGRWSTALYATRYGKTANFYAQSASTGFATLCTTGTDGYTTCPGTVAPWMVYNGSITYNLDDNLWVSAMVKNIRNSMPPDDYTYTTSPYYNPLNYNAYGRQFWVEFDWKFGGQEAAPGPTSR